MSISCDSLSGISYILTFSPKRVFGVMIDVLETKKDDETNNSEAVEKKETLSRESQSDTDLNRRDEFSQGKIDKDENK